MVREQVTIHLFNDLLKYLQFTTSLLIYMYPTPIVQVYLVWLILSQIL